jgi:hypothetical protein
MSKILKKIQAVELDCEKRTVKKIKKYNLPINIDRYIKEANACLWWYTSVTITRRWDGQQYSRPSVLKLMPTHFNNDYTVLPDNFLELVK